MTDEERLDATTERAPERELGVLGRLVVGIVVAVGVLASIPSVFSLLWFIPYAGVGALLVIRRPRQSIGWLLLGIGWAFALVTLPVPATGDQITSGTIEPVIATLAVLSVLPAPVFFLLFATLASVFPSGRLPRGRWGTVARVALGVGLVSVLLAALTPELRVGVWGSDVPVIIRNPAALLPGLPLWRIVTPDTVYLPLAVLMIAAVGSLFVRYRRAAGIERQQLRWITAAASFVVIAVVGGFVLSVLVPPLGESGLVWLGAIVAFPCVPVAVGIAVLRHRLYEIDTIINRAIVYGLVTAVLAGASAAVIGVTKEIFAGLLGPSSELSVIVSTLVVVSVFEPVKKAIGSLVDRLFREARDPAVVLGDLVAEVRTSLYMPDPERTLRRFLEVAVEAYDATSGSLRWVSEDGSGGSIAAAPEDRTGGRGRAAEPGAGARAGRRGDRGSDLTANATRGPTAATIDLVGARAPSGVDALEPALTAVLAELVGRGDPEGVASEAPVAKHHAAGRSITSGHALGRDAGTGGRGPGPSIDLSGGEA